MDFFLKVVVVSWDQSNFNTSELLLKKKPTVCETFASIIDVSI